MTHLSQSQKAIEAPRPSVADVQRFAAAQVSLPSRVGHVLLLVISMVMAAAVGSLWATEPSLPLRTHIAFALIVGGALAWAGFSAWVLARRRVLFGADRVLAARLGVTFAALGALGMGAMGYWTGALVQAALCGTAVVLLVRARRRAKALARRLRELDEQIAGVSSPADSTYS